MAGTKLVHISTCLKNFWRDKVNVWCFSRVQKSYTPSIVIEIESM